MLRASASKAPMAILSLFCMTCVRGLLEVAKSYTFENKRQSPRAFNFLGLTQRCRFNRHGFLMSGSLLRQVVADNLSHAAKKNKAQT